MLIDFIKTVECTSMPSHNHPDVVETMVALLSLSKFGDYRLSRKDNTYNYYIGENFPAPNYSDVLDAITCLIKQEKEEVFWSYLISIKIQNAHYGQLSDTMIAIIDATDATYFSSKYRAQWFFVMRLAIEANAEDLFARVSEIVRAWWFDSISNDDFSATDDDTKRFLIEYFNKMNCYTAITEFRQKQEIAIQASRLHKTTYWDAMLLGLGGADTFSIKIANYLWLVRAEADHKTHWKGSLRLFSWNYRGYLFLSSKQLPFDEIPYLDSCDVVPVLDNKHVISNGGKHSVFGFTWASELIYRLMSSYLTHSDESKNKLEEELSFMSEYFNEVLVGISEVESESPIGCFFFRELAKCLSSRPPAIRDKDELQVALKDVLNALHLLIIPEMLISPYPDNSKLFVSSILSKSNTDKSGWLLPYCLSRKPELEFWLSRCNTKNQVKMIISHLGFSPYEAIPTADGRRTVFLMEILSCA